MSRNGRIDLLDSTLREGEQTPGVSFTPDERVQIALKLSEAGIRMIEAGHPSVSEDVHEGIGRIVKLKDGGQISSEIIAHSRAVENDIQTAASLGVDRIAIFYGVSDSHLSFKTRKTREEALSIITEAISLAKSHGVNVRFTPEDATRADPEYLVEVIREAHEAGADRIGIADTVGILWPPQTKKLVADLRRRVKGVEFDIHAHNDLGNAVANSLSAVEGGATVVHCTVNGLGERVGITPTQVIAVALRYHLGVEVADLTAMNALSKMVENYSGVKLPPNFPITGDFAFLHKSGVHVAGILSNPSTYEFMDPSILGSSRDYVIDKYAGRHALESRMLSLGLALGGREVLEMLSYIKKQHPHEQLEDSALVQIARKITSGSLVENP